MNCDEEIIRSLKICTNGLLGCRSNKCPYFPEERGMHCFVALKMDALDLINRQQAEIEHWKAVTKAELDTIHKLGDDYGRVLEGMEECKAIIVQQQAENERLRSVLMEIVGD